MANEKHTIDPDQLPRGLSEEILEAYKIARTIKDAQGIDDPLELTIRLEQPARVYLTLGDVILAESDVNFNELAQIFQGEAPLRAAREESRLGPRLRQWGLALVARGRQWWEALQKAFQESQVKVGTRALLVSSLVVVLAAIPSYFVFLDRWIDARYDEEALTQAWQNVAFTSQLELPPYFLIIFVALLLLLLVLALVRSPKAPKSTFFRPRDEIEDPDFRPEAADPEQRRRGLTVMGVAGVAGLALIVRAVIFEGNLGFNWAAVYLALFIGLALWQGPWPRLRAWFTRLRLSELAAHLTLLGLLANLCSGWGNLLLLGPLFLLAWYNLLRHRREVGAVFWIVNIALVLYAIAINGWWFAVVGDEFIFFRDSVTIGDNGLRLINERLFDGTFIYGSHPFISSLLHFIFLNTFGPTSFAWRFSNLYLSAIALVFFYQFFVVFLPRRYALLAVTLLGASHYIMSFGKIGYNNLHAFLAMGLALGAAAWAIRRKSLLSFAALGAAVGFCFYVYPAALYIVPLPFLLLLLYLPPQVDGAWRYWATAFGSTLVLIFPLFLQPAYWTSKIAGTIAFNPDIVSSSSNTLNHFVTNMVYTLLSPLFITDESHFVAVGYLDFILAAFFFIGLALLLTRPWRHRMLAFTLFSFVYLALVVGASHDRALPPNTRMFLLLPLWVLIASYALAWLGAHLRDFGFSRALLRYAGVVLVLAIVAVNLYQAYPLTYLRSTRYHLLESIFLDMADNYFGRQPEQDKQVAVISEPGMVYVPALTELLDLYQVPYEEDDVIGVEEFPIENLDILNTLADEDSIVIVDLRLAEENFEMVNALLEDDYGKEACPVATVLNDVRFYLWHAPHQDWVCASTHPFGLSANH